MPYAKLTMCAVCCNPGLTKHTAGKRAYSLLLKVVNVTNFIKKWKTILKFYSSQN